MAGKVISKVAAGGENHLISSSFYGTCTTDATTAAKIVKITNTDINSLTIDTGMTLAVKFTNANSVANPTLTIQTSGGTELFAAKSIYRYGTTTPGVLAATSWYPGGVVLFVYDGTGWEIVNWLNDNTTYSAYSFGIGYGTCATAAATAAKAVTCANYALHNYGIVTVKFTNAVTVANPTLNVNSKGAKAIYWHGAALTDTGLIRAGSIVTFQYNTYDNSNGVYEIISMSPVTQTTTNFSFTTPDSGVTDDYKLVMPAGFLTSVAC